MTSLSETARYLAGAGIRADVGPEADGARALIAPTETRGMWIEFREIR